MSAAQEIVLPCLAESHLAAKAWGDRNKAVRVVLCVHGSLDNAASFDGLGHALSQRQSYAIAVDLLGHGRSPTAPGGVYGIDVWALAITDALMCSGWSGELVIVGHSLGTAVATLVAGALATTRSSGGLRLTHVVLIDGGGIGNARRMPAEKPPRSFLQRQQLMRRGLARRGSEAKTKFPSLEAAVQRRLARNVGGQPIKRSTAAAIVARDVSIDAETGACVFTHDVPQLMFSALPLMTPSSEAIDAYYRVLPKVLFIVAHSPQTGNPYFPDLVGWVSTCSQKCNDATVVKVQGYHHWHADEAEECASLVMKFLNDERFLGDDRDVAASSDPAQYDVDAATKEASVAEQFRLKAKL